MMPNTARRRRAARLTAALSAAFVLVSGSPLAEAAHAGTAPAISRPDRSQDPLSFFTGVWHGSGTLYANAFQPTDVPITIVMINTRILDGAWLEQIAELRPKTPGGQPVKGRYIWGRKAGDTVLSAEWFDNSGGRSTQTSPGWEGDRLVFTGHVFHGGPPAPLRDTFIKKGPNEYLHIAEIDLGSGWVRLEEETLRRVL